MVAERVPQDSLPPLDAVVNDIAELRPMSPIATQILEITEGDRFSAHELATAISSDPALSAKILRLSNSAYYGFPRRISTVRDAVVLLGFRAVRSATLAQCVIDAVPPSTNIDYDVAWSYSISVGMLAELLGRAERTHQDEAFTAGVLHNIGRLAFDQHLPERFTAAVRLAAQEEIALADAQRELVGFSDAELGGALAAHWSFPEPLTEAVAQHLTPPSKLKEPTSLAAFVVRARLFARSYGLTDSVDPPAKGEPPDDWTVPPVSVALRRAGGMSGVIERASAFMKNTLSQ